MLDSIGADVIRVLREKDLDGLDALVLPGGESTTISKGLDRLGLYPPIRAFAEAGKPVLGTCAGAILLARDCENHAVRTLSLIDAVAVRNAYGTQVDSFAAVADPGAIPACEGFRCVFIRAPKLREPSDGVEVLVRVNGEPVLIRQGRILACAFHPELTDDARVHRLLLDEPP
jgi:5'-phosphate synthase pdxT subunit